MKTALNNIATKISAFHFARFKQAKFPVERFTTETTEYELLKKLIEGYTVGQPPKILIFGDSVYIRVASDDNVDLSLEEMLGIHYKNHVFQVIGSGYHSGIFERFSSLFAAHEAHPRIVILPINLRSFSPTWDLNPLYQFHAEVELLSTYEASKADYQLPDVPTYSGLDNHSVLLGCKGQKPITLDEFLAIIGEHPEPGSEEWETRLKTIFQYHYTCPLKPTHRKLQSLKNTIRYLNEIGVAVYSYITPINYEAGIEYCGDSFVTRVKENVSIIQYEIESIAPRQYEPGGTPMFLWEDFSFRFGKNVFFTPHNATEHLRFKGREFLSRRIHEAVQNFKISMS